METKEAITRIKNLINPYYCYELHSGISNLHPLTCEALRMAIKALKQQDIIRCKNCYWYEDTLCKKYSVARLVGENDFCSKADRKGGD